MQKKSTKLLFNYWNNLRGTKNAPERKQLDPVKLRKILGNIFILESKEQEENFKFRLVGSHLYLAYCRELKGRFFLDLWREKDDEAMKTLLKAVTEDNAVALTSFQGTSTRGKKVNFEIMLLPLRHNGNTNTRILGSLSAFEEPYWLGLEPIIEQKITGLRLIWPDDMSNQAMRNIIAQKDDFVSDVHFGNRQSQPAVSKIIATSTSFAGNDARRYSHLTVIDGGKLQKN